MTVQTDGNELQGKVAIVTGAASGIGRATAQRLAGAGATVIAADRDEAGVRDTIGLLADDRHEAVVLDVTDEAAWERLSHHAEERHGRLDILINNAGYGSFRSIADTSLAQWRDIMAVNLDSVFLACRSMLPLLTKSPSGGAIVNMSSIRGIAAAANVASYCAAKGGVRLFTKALALECAAQGNRVRANSIHPGHILTPLSAAAHADEATHAKLMADIPVGRAGTADEIADAILFLASDRSRYMTGAELVVDGGSTAQ